MSDTSFSTDFYAPNLAEITLGSGTFTAGDATGAYGGIHYQQHALQTAYDGFTLSAASGNVTGEVRVYGYRNST